MSTAVNINEESGHTDTIGDKAVKKGNGSMVDKGKLYTTKWQGSPAKTGTGERARQKKEERKGQ